MNASLTEFHTFLGYYAETLEAAAEKQEEKYQSLVSFDSTRVFKSVTDLQAVTLQLEKLEVRRMALQEKAGLGTLGFREMLSALPKTDRQPFEEVFRRFQAAVWNVKFLNEKSLTFAQSGVEALRGDDQGIGQNLYTSPKEKGTKSAEARPLFDANY